MDKLKLCSRVLIFWTLDGTMKEYKILVA